VRAIVAQRCTVRGTGGPASSPTTAIEELHVSVVTYLSDDRSLFVDVAHSLLPYQTARRQYTDENNTAEKCCDLTVNCQIQIYGTIKG